MRDRTRILIVEDVADLREELVDYVQRQGFETAGVGSLAEMRSRLAVSTWHILVLDLGLPDGDGLAAARALRERLGLELGIIMMTARGHTDDRIAGLEAGADTYLVKPVNPRELKAVIDRLTHRLSVPPRQDSTSQQALGSWRLDSAHRTLRCPDGTRILLTGAETVILESLLQAAGAIVARDILARRLHGHFAGRETRRLDTLISRLRTKVMQESGQSLPLSTFRNLGYAFHGSVG